MIKIYFKLEYNVFYGMDGKEPIEDKYSIGFFSSKQKATEAIEIYKQSGKEEYLTQNFFIRRVRVNCFIEPSSLFLPYHEYSVKDGDDEFVDFYYIFPPKVTRDEAQKFCSVMKTKRKYAQYEERDYSMYPPDGFGIDEYIIDKIYH